MTWRENEAEKGARKLEEMTETPWNHAVHSVLLAPAQLAKQDRGMLVLPQQTAQGAILVPWIPISWW